jgi:pimeloyl-ACP methyl ester carboxylesterase
LQLSYLDFGGEGAVLVALHGHYCEAAEFGPLAERLAPDWRVIALDQRGHGESDRAVRYDRAGYVADALAFLDHLGLASAPVLGHSLGGANAYQLAARHPERVSALVVEDIGADVRIDPAFAQSMPRSAASREELMRALGQSARYFTPAFRERADGWGFSFDIDDTLRSEAALSADHWADWLAVRCPVLLIHGTRSDILTGSHAQDMVARLGGAGRLARLAELPAGHVVHTDQPQAYADLVRAFLSSPLG